VSWGSSSPASPAEGVVPPCTAPVRPHLKHWAQLWALVKERHETIGVCPEEGDQDGAGSRGRDLRGAAEVTWLVQHGDVKAEGDLITEK